MEYGYLIGGGILVIIAVIGFFVLGAAKRKQDAIIGTETYSAKEVAEAYQTTKTEMLDGAFSFPCELVGKIACDAPLTAPMSGKPGVWYRSLVEIQRQVTEWQTDAQGRRRQVTRQVWDTLSDETRAADFAVEDDSGKMKVEIKGAEIIGAQRVLDRFEPAPKSFGADRVLGQRKQEWLLPSGVPVYTLGVVTDTGGELAMRKTGDEKDRFIVSLKSERELISELGGRVKFWRVLTPVLGIAGLIVIALGFILP